MKWSNVEQGIPQWLQDVSQSASDQAKSFADVVSGANPAINNARASSLYPHSDQFSLTVTDDTDDRGFNNIDNVLDRGRSSFYAGNGAYYDQEEDFAVYEDGADADAYVPSSCGPRFVRSLTRCFCRQVPKHSRARHDSE